MKTKMFYGNQFVGTFRCDGRKRTIAQRFVDAYKKYISITAVLVIGGYLFAAGGIMAKATIEPGTIFAKEIVEVPIIKIAPVMERIKQCESGGKHFDPKTGQVYMLANTNKTVDVGMYMINTVWHKKAKELGHDITTEEGNEAMAYWLYENYGTEPWIYSKHCWNK